MIVNAVMLIYGRPLYTHITLESLWRSNLGKSEDFHLGAIIVDHPQFSVKAIRNMLGKYPFVKCPIIEQKVGINSGSYSSRLCCMLGYIYANKLESEWFVYIENDVLFNPDWFDRILEMHEEASQKYKVGIISPLNNLHRGTISTAYGNTYRGKNKFEGQVWAMREEVLRQILEYPESVWAKKSVGFDQRILGALHSDGYMSITSNNSHVAHIGYVGSKGNPMSIHSRRFYPHASIADLYSLSESSKDGWGNGREFTENG